MLRGSSHSGGHAGKVQIEKGGDVSREGGIRKEIGRSGRTNQEKIVLGNSEGKHNVYVVEVEFDRGWSIRCWEEKALAAKRGRSHVSGAPSKLAGKNLGTQHSEKRKVLVRLNLRCKVKLISSVSYF